MSESDRALIDALRALARVRARKIGTEFWGNLVEAVAANRLEALAASLAAHQEAGKQPGHY